MTSWHDHYLEACQALDQKRNSDMPTPTPTPVPAASERLDRLTDAIVDDILKAPDEEVLCDAILDIVAKLRAENAEQADTITQLRAEKLQLMQALARFTGGA